MRLSRSVLLSAMACAAACTSSRGPAPGLTPVSELSPPFPVMQFAGQFTPVVNTMSGSAMASGTTRINGTVKLTSQPGSDDQFSVVTDFVSERGAESLLWSIVDGRCGSTSLPLVPPRELIPIEVPSTGRVHLNTEFRATMVATRAYHLNLYANGGTDLEAVIGCANLKG